MAKDDKEHQMLFDLRGRRRNVIKVVWGSDWDPLLEKDHNGLLVKRMGEIVDGDLAIVRGRERLTGGSLE